MEKKAMIDAGNHIIPAIVYIPDIEIKGAVVMLHGTGSHKNEVGNGFAAAAKILAEKYGLANIRFDFMGCGDSSEKYRDYNFKTAIEDTLLAKEYLMGQLEPEVKVGIMGWSQGGMLAMLVAARNKEVFAAVVTWAGAISMKDGLLNDELYREAKEKGFFVSEFSWCNPIEFGLEWCEDVINTDVLAEFAVYDGPVLAINGTEDTIVPAECASKIVSASKNRISREFLLEGGNHLFNVFTESDYKSLITAIHETGKFFGDNLC